jgi:hypothetical protein
MELCLEREKFSPEKIEQFGQMAAMVASVVGQECASSISEIIDLFCLVRPSPSFCSVILLGTAIQLIDCDAF